MFEKSDTVVSLPDSGQTPDSVLMLEATPSTWDTCLFQHLWSARLTTGLEAAETLFAAEKLEDTLPIATEQMTALFWRTINRQYPVMPATAQERYRVVVLVIQALLRITAREPGTWANYQHIAVALRPIRRLQIRSLSSEVCEILYNYHRGVWDALSASEKFVLRVALAKTMAAFPADDLQTLWEGLLDANPLRRQAMMLGLRFLRSQHAVPHLLHGLEVSRDHAVRSAIVDCLEEIADPRAIALLTRLHRETAQGDWTLSRHIARVIKVIEQQNRGQMHRVLLRPATTPADTEQSLLRPATAAQSAEKANALLRPTSAERQNEPQPEEAPLRPIGEQTDQQDQQRLS